MALIKIGNWNYNPDYGRLSNTEGKEIFLDKRLNKLLTFLMNRKTVVVKRNEIIEFVWSDVQVNEENLTKGIFDLRKLLKENDIFEIEITTIRNVGYRLQIIEEKSKKRAFSKLVLKSVMYLFLISSFIVLFIRAIRYEN